MTVCSAVYNISLVGSERSGFGYLVWFGAIHRQVEGGRAFEPMIGDRQ